MFERLNEFAPTVTTSRLALRLLCPADAFPLFDATRNPEFNRHLLWNQPDDIQLVHDRVEYLMNVRQLDMQASVCAVVKTTGQFVSLFRMTLVSGSAVEMGLWTHPTFWGGGYGTELTRAAIKLLFKYTDFNEIRASSSPENIGACAVLQKCGMVPTEMEVRYREDDTKVSLIRHCLFRSEFVETQS